MSGKHNKTVNPKVVFITQEEMEGEMLNLYAKAFALWEKGFRKKPETFMTNEECAKMAVASLSVQRAMCFAAYVRKVQ
jgi:hypothetical protein